MDPKKLFPEVPADLSSLTSEDLEERAKTIRERIVEIKEKRHDPEVVGDLSTTEVHAQAAAAVAEFERINDAIASRVLEDTKYEEGLDELVAKVAPKEEPAAEVVAEGDDAPEPPAPAPDPDPDPEVAEVVAEVEAPAEPVAEIEVAEVVVEPEPVLVAAARLPRPRPENAPMEVATHGTALVASAGISGIAPGKELSRLELAEAVIKTIRGGSIAQGSQKVIVASADYSDRFPDELRLLPHDGWQRTMEKIDAAYGPAALTAAGGLCAPLTPYYELMNVAVADRPVRDALANFNAVRGGLQFAAPPTIADITGVGVKTAADDALGGTFATKVCQVVECPEFSSVEIEAIYHCLQFGNFNARAFPEMIATYNDLVMAAHAALAEQALLDGISAASVHVTDAATYGAASTLLSGILQAAAGIRSQLRMAAGTRLRVLMPAWVADLVTNDLVNQQFGRFETARDAITALLDRMGNVTITWYLDTNTGGGQKFPVQAGTATLNSFPTEALWYIFPEGSFLFLDGGTLDLGIVRDSTLNATNDFQIFGETFENVAFVGPLAYRVASAVCADGTVAAPATAITC